MTSRSKLLGACAAALSLAGIAVPAAGAAPLPIVRTYDMRLSIQMKSTFAFQPVTVECGGPKLEGYSGRGEEIMDLASPKPVRVQLFAAKGAQPSVTRKDLKPNFELRGETRRSGGMTWQVCGKEMQTRFADCLGKHPIATSVGLQFLSGSRWTIGDSLDQSTRDVVKACDDNAGFDWDGAVSRAGITLITSHIGKAPASKLRRTRGPFAITASGRDTCEAADFGTGTCVTEWSFKARFTPVTKKRKRRG